jgi:hypothetical protein
MERAAFHGRNALKARTAANTLGAETLSALGTDVDAGRRKDHLLCAHDPIPSDLRVTSAA